MEKTELTVSSFVETELARFETAFTKESLIALADSVKELSINGVNDKAGLKSVESARKTLKSKRVEIEKASQSLRASAVKFQKAVIAKEEELVNYVHPTELLLSQVEKDHYEELERLRIEEERKESDRIQARIDKLNAVGHAVDFHELKAMTDDRFESLLLEAKEVYENRLIAEAEAKRKLEEEQAEEKRKEEQLKLEADRKRELERIELERLRQEQIDRENKFIEDQAKKQRQLDDERSQVLAKAKALQDRENELNRQEQERIQKAKAEQDRIEAAAKAKKEAEDAALMAEEERLAQEALELEELTEKELFEKDKSTIDAFEDVILYCLTSKVDLKSKRGIKMLKSSVDYLELAIVALRY